MSDHPNLEAARTGYAAFAAGDMGTLGPMLADDVVWHVGGDNPLSGDYTGREEVLGFFGRLMQKTGGTFKNEIHDMVANDEHGIAIVEASARRNGKWIDDRAVHVFHMADGQITEFWNIATDQNAWDDFYS